MSDDLTVRCIGPRCAEEEQPRPTRIGLLCGRCYRHLERVIAEMPAKADLLAAMIGHSGGAADGGRSGKPGSRPPVNVPRHDLSASLHALVGSWVQLVAEERTLRGPDPVTVRSGSQWLLSQLDWIVGQPWVDDMLTELAEATREVDGLTGWRLGWHSLPAPCPGCGGDRLGRWDGDDHVGCGECGERWPENDYARLVQVLACDTGTSVTAQQGAERAGVKPATFRQWVSRGMVRRLGTVDGMARYSTADLDAVIDRDDTPDVCA